MSKKSIETFKKFAEYYDLLVKNFHSSQSSDQIRELNTMSVEMSDFLREEYQAETSVKVRELINKLKNQNNNSLDLELLENYIIGDAKSYIEAFEPTYQNCLQTLIELTKTLKEFDYENYNDTDLIIYLGKAKTLIKITENMSFYLQEKKRINDFKTALSNGIDKVEAHFFSDILDFKLKSPTC